MPRRSLLKTAAALALVVAACAVGLRPAWAQPSFTVSAEQLQQTLAARFPRRYPLAGLVQMEVQTPNLRLLPAANRLGAEMAVEASGPALGRRYTGQFDVDFGLRYEASDQSIRATQLRVNSLRLSGLPAEVSMLLSAYGGALADQALLEVVLHRLEKKDLAMADVMGLEPGTFTVTEQGVVIGLVNKPLR